MYYRNNNFGCFILLLLVLFTMGAFLRLLFTPVFWIVVGIVALISAVQKYLYKRNREDEYESGYEGSRTYGNSGNRSYPEEDVDYSEGADDPNRMEQVYETNAVDVDDVEVTRDDD